MSSEHVYTGVIFSACAFTCTCTVYMYMYSIYVYIYMNNQIKRTGGRKRILKEERKEQTLTICNSLEGYMYSWECVHIYQAFEAVVNCWCLFISFFLLFLPPFFYCSVLYNMIVHVHVFVVLNLLMYMFMNKSITTTP